MRKRIAGLIGTSAVALVAALFGTCASFAQLPGRVTPYAPSEDEIVPDVVPGDHIAIACGPVEQRSKDSDVRVVLTISAIPGDSGPGYKKVLATDSELLKDAVRVRIPDVPDLEDHTVDLNVYVVDDSGSHRCEAGQMKIS